MKIIADENIPAVKDVFAGLGSVQLLPGRDMNRSSVSDADVLLVRSVTVVDEELLAGSRVRFVGTATIGTDHVDERFLREAGIGFAGAPGSNACSVAEYVTAALLTVASREGEALSGRSLGVIGVGNVGSRVVEKAEALGMKVVRNDPPLARSSGEPSYRPVEEALGCDYVTLHVPLEKGGLDPTCHMAGENFLNAMNKDAVLLNSSRGAVVDESALKRALKQGRIRGAVLDVWENEPCVDPELLELACIATPHVAGYSLDGKFAGVRMLYEALCAFLNIEPQLDVDALKPPPQNGLFLIEESACETEILCRAVRHCYDIERDDRKLRRMLSLPCCERGRYFDGLRKNYPVRREFGCVTAALAGGMDGAFRLKISRALEQLGFAVERHAGRT